MPLAIVLMLLDVTLVVHAAKTGRFNPWGYVIVLLPGIGAIAYIVVELVPEWFGSPQAHRTRKTVMSKLDPEKRYRILRDKFETLDTVGTRADLAEECLALGKFDEAKALFDVILTMPLGDEPIYYLGRARAEFGLGEPQQTVVTLDELRARWPDYQSAEGHLLYARALEEAGRLDEALDEYQAVSDYFAGAEATVRWGLLLQRMGHGAEAQKLFQALVTRLRRAPKYVRKTQAEWIAVAEKALRG